ncbi:MAG: hypothetical protein UX09_C0019G0009 [Candidatus Uhrbacteria bacterium GW2011_GWE2_45_35]|uniref:Uncharacterized protein n=1 Tax=Candidatus Uhrbacteria bacterium GW2011_GWE2_45_35 TaxID=1618993 RepID=A0A0G1QI05_9BACT|nr:MAG: hypothetical protein UX09_C0019G0009 [Candidatus Uhrbacteria bacterium GW2011_GWE2_45_35]
MVIFCSQLFLHEVKTIVDRRHGRSPCLLEIGGCPLRKDRRAGHGQRSFDVLATTDEPVAVAEAGSRNAGHGLEVGPTLAGPALGQGLAAAEGPGRCRHLPDHVGLAGRVARIGFEVKQSLLELDTHDVRPVWHDLRRDDDAFLDPSAGADELAAVELGQTALRKLAEEALGHLDSLEVGAVVVRLLVEQRLGRQFEQCQPEGLDLDRGRADHGPEPRVVDAAGVQGIDALDELDVDELGELLGVDREAELLDEATAVVDAELSPQEPEARVADTVLAGRGGALALVVVEVQTLGVELAIDVEDDGGGGFLGLGEFLLVAGPHEADPREERAQQGAGHHIIGVEISGVGDGTVDVEGGGLGRHKAPPGAVGGVRNR